MKETMGSFFGFTLFIVGLVAVAMGVWGVFWNSALIGGALVIGGGIAALSGVYFASMAAKSRSEIPTVGNYLFALCFIVSVFIVVIGLTGVFSNTVASLYLIVVASLGMAYSAWSVVRRSRLG